MWIGKENQKNSEFKITVEAIEGKGITVLCHTLVKLNEKKQNVSPKERNPSALLTAILKIIKFIVNSMLSEVEEWG